MFAVQNGVVTYNGVPENLVPDAQRQAAYGRLGNINFGGASSDPRFYNETIRPADDSGNATSEYSLKPEYQRWDGLMQVGIPRSVGGYAEVRDPSGIFWDDDLGYVTHVNNINGPDEGGIGGFLGRYLVPALALGGLGAIGMVGGFSGLLGGAAAGEAAASAAGAAGGGAGASGLGTYGAMTAGLDGLTGTLAAEGLGASAGAGGTGLGVYGGMTTGLDGLSTASQMPSAPPPAVTPWYSQLLQQAASNPLQAARAGMGLANIVDALGNRNGGSTPSGDGLLNSGTANVTPFNPMGLLSGYKPMQFDPVPFMSGRYGG